MLILGIDTSTDICSVGLSYSKKFIGEINIKLDKRHSERLVPIIKHLFSESGYKMNEIDGIVVTEGPGSFTGLRIGLSTVQAFKQALEVPVYSISSLEFMAESIKKYYSGYIFVPTIDARNKRVYTSLFKDIRKLNLKRITDDQALQVNDLVEILNNYQEKILLFGPGIDNYKDQFITKTSRNISIIEGIDHFGGYDLALIGYSFLKKGINKDYNDLIPKYLKKPQARINWEKKFLQGD
ncbi:MAG: tRNA (adenosine(37)-N6)-threonylcarbamoyltransferase complex dimerization subunit type 1 TsaB [Halanaerobiales bacterium]|nr:tRNA (adenosine(37)-N6)-threonylcarbamoyltransferase complex dimerization subunit type 1 TsaB [Halanaerobiales bacterium]